MLSKVRVKVGGKINLSLNITGKRSELHTLDSIVASVDLCDTVTVRDRLDDKINLIFNGQAVKNNTVLKAVNVMRKSFGPFGADIVVEKRLPIGGGMGGSSADAAGTIVALDRLFDFGMRGLNIRKTCVEVGSDVYYMTKGGYARLFGIGDDVAFYDIKKEYGIICIYGGESLTAKVYSTFDKVGGEIPIDNDRLIRSLYSGERPLLGNMLTRAAVSLNDEIKTNMDALSSVGLEPNMTGSGSTVYAFSDDPSGDVARLNEKGIKAFSAQTKAYGIEFE